ncbi:MAG: 2-oxoacid:ferredoxin oxidoreductase subunit beta [Planctomycetes bacterium]|nr:2-oxoacid:ferredoxin oxidoreductase subunit beta [Planctomycetota bacterium]
MTETVQSKLTRKDFQSDQEVRWCPGCGDYVILAQVQKMMPELGIARENIAFVSGIGCSSRFPYYMNTYGFHTIHGRAPAIATGLKASRPDLQVWVVTGDGDALSIGGNHFIHVLRRNVDLKILLFNNRIYGLTKGQASPTSELGKKAKSTPYGTIDAPFNPMHLALGAGATFVARTSDADPVHMTEMLRRVAQHKGSAFLEILQNCVVFNDAAFESFTAKDMRASRQIYLEQGKPLVYAGGTKGLRLVDGHPEVLDLASGKAPGEPMIWNEQAEVSAAFALSTCAAPDFPEPVGVLRAVDAPVHHILQESQSDAVRKKLGAGNLAKLLTSGDTWTIS